MLRFMPARSIASSTISFGLVSIPVKLFTATQSQTVRFNMLHKECNTRVKQQLYCPTCDVIVPRDDTIKGYEVAKGQYVTFGAEELRALESERTNTIDIVEFVPAASIDFIQIDKTYYLGPDKGGNKAYNLLGHAMRDTDVVAIGRYSARGKSYVVMIRPYLKGLALHQLYYAEEVRAFEDVELGDDTAFSEAEQELAERLIEQLKSGSFDPSRYRDDYSDRVREVAEQKAQGMEISAAPEQPAAQIIDLFEALKRSLESDDEAAASDTDETAEAQAAEGPKGTRKAATKKKKKAKKAG